MRVDSSKLRMIIIVAVIVIVLVYFVLPSGDDGNLEDLTGVSQTGDNGYYNNDTGTGYSDNSSNGSIGGGLLSMLLGDTGNDYGSMLSGWFGSNYESNSYSVSVNDPVGIDLSSVPEGKGTATVLIYCVGSNLESESGCATSDIKEMLNSGIGGYENVNIIIETGGAKKWRNNVVDAGKLQRFRLQDNGMVLLEEYSKTSMVSPSTLQDFISWGFKNYPADTMGFIFWDHGGGTIAGFGHDELFKGSLTLQDIDKAFKGAGKHFDFVGFDACLMGTVETAYMLSDHADYMIASEETEPGSGWYYTGWLQVLARNPQVAMDLLGKQIVDDFVRYSGTGGQSTSLAVIDLKKVPAVYDKLCDFMANAKNTIVADGYKKVSGARNNARDYGDGQYEQIDIIDFAQKSGVSGANEVISAVQDCILYHNTNLSGTNGLAMYFPYKNPGYYSTVNPIINSVGMTDSDYNGFFDTFLSIMTGNRTSNRSFSMVEKLTGDTETEDYSSEAWYEEEYASLGTTSAMSVYAGKEMITVDKGDYYALELTVEQLEELNYADLYLYLDDGEGYIDMGHDNIVEFDDDGALKVDFDYNWIAINGQICPFYAVEEGNLSDGSWYTYGYADAMLTDTNGDQKEIDLIVQWDDHHEGGFVKGYRTHMEYDEGNNLQAERALMQFSDGDQIEFICDYYTYDGEYDDAYIYGDPIVVNGKMTVSYENLGEISSEIFVHIVDIYNNDYWSEVIRFDY